ncbi:MAG: hypothetical protein WAV09_00435 [Minisyncoccia bacterium]
MNKLFLIFVLGAVLFLQGCATNKSNIWCAGPQGCQSKTVASNTQWSVQLGDNLFVHPQYKDLYVHQETGAWEPSQTCGSPSLLRTLTYSLIGGVASGVAYKFVSNPYAAGAVGGAANGLANQMNQSGLNQACRNAATVAAQHNAEPQVAREIIRWSVRKNLETTKITQEIINEETGVAGTPALGQTQYTSQQVSLSFEQNLQILKGCAGEAQVRFPNLFGRMTPEQVIEDMESRCQAKGKGGFGVLPGGNQCGCGGA